MNKRLKLVLICLIFTLFVPLVFMPGTAAAAQQDLTTKYLVFLQEKEINNLTEGNISVVFGSSEIKSDVRGSVIVVLGKASIKGSVSGDVVSVFGDIDVLKGSRVLGNLVSIGRLNESSDVVINGSRFVANIDIISLFKSNGILINASILYALIVLIAGLILITIFPDRYRAISYSIGKRVRRRMILGGLAVIGITILLAFFIFSLVASAVYVLFLMFAGIVASIYLGTLIFKESYERSAIYLDFFVGHILISILKIVPLIFLPVGSYKALLIYGICYIIFELTMASWGIGTIIDTAFGKKGLKK